MTTSNTPLEIIEFTDPISTWCWGSEPVLRKLETKYGEQIRVSFVMGGMAKDITSFYNSHNDIGGDPERANAKIAMHWAEASGHHGMPVKVEGLRLFSREHPSSYPQNIAYKAAQIQNPLVANRFLRRIREASAAEAKQTNLTEVLFSLASEVGLEMERFREDFSSGAAQTAFEEDLATTAQYNVHGFPSFLVRYRDKEILLHGFKKYENFKAVIAHLSNGKITERHTVAKAASIMAFIQKYGSVTPIEIQTAFDLSFDGLMSAYQSLLENELITYREAGNGYFISMNSTATVCDPAVSMCPA